MGKFKPVDTVILIRLDVERLFDFTSKDKLRLFQIVTSIIISAYIIDIFLQSNKLLVLYNYLSIAISVAALLLHQFSRIAINSAVKIVIYTLIACILISNLSDFSNHSDISSLLSASIIGALLPFAGILLGRRHAIYIGSLLMIFSLIITQVISGAFDTKDKALAFILLAGYIMVMYYLMYLIEEGNKNRKLHERLQKEQEGNNQFMHTLSLDLAACSGEEVTPIMTNTITDFTKAPLVVFSIFDKERMCMRVNCIRGNQHIIDQIDKLSGKLLSDGYAELTMEKITSITANMLTEESSLSTVSLGYYTETQSDIIKQATGLTTFIAINHKLPGQYFGTTVLGLTDSIPIPDINILNAFNYISSVTLKRHFTERSLIESEARMRQITNQIADVVYVSDLNLKVHYVSPSIERLTGNNPDDHKKLPITERYSQPSIMKLKAAVQKELEAEKNPQADKNRTTVLDVQMLNNRGELIDVSIHLSLFRNKKGEPTGIQGIIRDITDKKTAERELIKSQAELKRIVADKDRFMQVISHDLRMPFQSLIGFSELLLNSIDIFSETEIKEMLQQINQTSTQTYFMFDNLLMWAKEQAGKLSINPKETDIRELIQSVANDTALIASYKNITIVNNATSNNKIYADENIIKTTLRNLISNAIKFSNPDSEVKIDTQWNKNSIIISVADKGIGIEADNIEKLLNTQEFLSTAGTSGEHGSGTGLSLCRQLIERHNGRIWVESIVGEGSTFKIEIPLKG